MEYKYMCIVDADNIYRDLAYVCVTKADDVSTAYEVQNYKLQDNEYLLEATKPTICRYSGGAGFVKPRWDEDAETWVEGATAEQITAWEQENPDPVSVEEKRATKIVELSAACEAAINAGTTVPMPDQTQEVFTYSTADQANVSEMFMACLMGADGYLYHENGGECRLYSKAEIVAIYGTLSMYKTGQLTYHNQIK